MMLNDNGKFSNFFKKLSSSTYIMGYQYLIFNVVAFAFVLLINLLFPLFFGSEVYGFFVLLFSIYSFLVPIFVFGLDSALFRYYFVSYFPTKNLLISAAFFSWLYVGIAILSLLFILIYFSSVDAILSIGKSDLVMVSIASFLSAPISIVSMSFIAKEKPKYFGSVMIVSKVMQFLILLVVPALFNISTNGFSFLFLLFSISNIIIAFSFVHWCMIHPSFSQIKELLKFSAPLSLNSLFSLGFSHGYKIFISPLLTFTQLGILNIVIQFGSIFTIVSNSMANSYNPVFFKQLSESRRQLATIIKPYFRYVLFNNTILLFFILLIGIPFFQVYKQGEFSIGSMLLPILMFGVLGFSFKSIGNGLLTFYKKTYISALVTTALSIVSLVLGTLLTERIGLFGTVLALSIGYSLQGLVFNLTGLYKRKVNN